MTRELRATIKRFGLDHGIGAEGRSRLYEKLSELRRSALAPRIVRVAKALELDLDVLWPNRGEARRRPLERRLSEMYRRRSILVHNGTIDDVFDLQGDVLRANALVELLVYCILGADFKWLAPFPWLELMQQGRYGRPRVDPDNDDLRGE